MRNAALNAWFGHSRAVAEKHYDRVTDDDFADAIRAGGQLVGQSEGRADASTKIKDDRKPTKRPLLRPADGVRSGLGYTLEDSLE